MTSPSRPVRLLVDARHLDPPWTGVGRYSTALLEELAARPGFHLGLLATPRQQEALAGLRLPGVEFLPARFGITQHPFYELENLLRVARLARGFEPDLCWGPAFDGSSWDGRAPRLVTVHDAACFHHRDTMPARFAWLLRHKVTGAATAGAWLGAPSELVRRELQELFPAAAGRVVTVGGGVLPRFFSASDEDAARAREALALPPNFLLSMGGMHPRKGAAGLIEVLAGIPEAPPLVVAGTPAPEATPRVIGLGRVPEEHLPGLYRAARLVVLAARYEGFGLVPLEAMACQTPVVATRVGAVPEVFPEGDAEELTVVEPGDAEAMAAALRAALAQDVPEAARARMRARVEGWTWARCAARHVEVFERMLAAS